MLKIGVSVQFSYFKLLTFIECSRERYEYLSVATRACVIMPVPEEDIYRTNTELVYDSVITTCVALLKIRNLATASK